MLVTIIIPCYNAEEFVGEAIESALNQTYANTEIIIVNNGSDDNTEQVLTKYKLTYPNLITTDEHKKGACAARNKGLSIANGDYIQFLDADDLLVQDKLEQQVAILNREPELPDFIAAESIVITPPLQKTITLSIDREENLWYGLMTGRLGNTCSNLFKKTSLIAIGGWNEQIRSSQEADLMYRLLKNNAKVIFDYNNRAIIRRINESSISASDKKNNYLRYVDLRIKIYHHLELIGYFDKYDATKFLHFLFTIIRTLYTYDPDKAIDYHNSLLDKNFAPETKNTKEAIYKIIYNMFGFNNTERLFRLFRSIYNASIIKKTHI